MCVCVCVCVCVYVEGGGGGEEQRVLFHLVTTKKSPTCHYRIAGNCRGRNLSQIVTKP